MKSFLAFQFMALAGYAVWWFALPKDSVATAIVKVTAHLPSLDEAGTYAAPADAQITGTVGRGFQEMRVLNAIVSRHPEWAMSAESILGRLAVTPNRLNSTVELSFRAHPASLAFSILEAIVEERRNLDAEIQRGQREAQLGALNRRIEELNAALRGANEQVTARSRVSGDPDELETQLWEGRRRASMIEQALVEFSARATQLNSKLEFLDVAIADARAGNFSKPFTGFEVFDAPAKIKGDLDFSAGALNGQARDSEVAGAWASVMHGSTFLAAVQGAYGPRHPKTIDAEARLDQDRARLLAALNDQRHTIKGAADSLNAAAETLGKEVSKTQEVITLLRNARFDPEILRLRQTAIGLSNAYREADIRRHALMSAATVTPAQFFVVQPPVASTHSIHPAPLPLFILLELVVILAAGFVLAWRRNGSLKTTS